MNPLWVKCVVNVFPHSVDCLCILLKLDDQKIYIVLYNKPYLISLVMSILSYIIFLEFCSFNLAYLDFILYLELRVCMCVCVCVCVCMMWGIVEFHFLPSWIFNCPSTIGWKDKIFSHCYAVILTTATKDSLSHVQLSATPWTVAHQGPLSMGVFRQDYWSGLPFPSPMILYYKTSICIWVYLFLDTLVI